ncbi:MAG: 3-deoxy-D-manno-octulosonic acid transferase [Pseudomonadota bacterium]
MEAKRTEVIAEHMARVEAAINRFYSTDASLIVNLDETGLYFRSISTKSLRRGFGYKPEIAIIMETEIWPNLYNECGIRGVPLVLASARISPRSVDRYKRLVPLFREALSHGIVIAAQSEADAQRFRDLGAATKRTFVTGNLKFDVELDPALPGAGMNLRRSLGLDRPVWIAASTHAGEEEMVVEAHAQLRKRMPEALLILVPRHPERFDDVAKMLEEKGVSFVRRTEGGKPTVSTAVYLGDTMGEVPRFYAASEVAFVGGSLVPIGGHNLLEPAAQGKPVISGPYCFNSEDIARMLFDSGACLKVENAEELHLRVFELLSDEAERRRRGAIGQGVIEQNRGALTQLLGLIAPLISAKTQRPEV